MAITNDGYYEALWPRSPRQTKIRSLAKRLGTLEGKRSLSSGTTYFAETKSITSFFNRSREL